MAYNGQCKQGCYGSNHLLNYKRLAGDCPYLAIRGGLKRGTNDEELNNGSLAEWSKAPASGAGPQGREFESHSFHLFCLHPHFLYSLQLFDQTIQNMTQNMFAKANTAVSPFAQAPSFAPQAPSFAPQTPSFAPQTPTFAPQAPSFATQASSFAPQAPQFGQQPAFSQNPKPT